MSRRSRFAGPAEAWLRRNGGEGGVPTRDFWNGLCEDYPELTTPTSTRKTPKATCMRDLRYDPAFELGQGKIRLKQPA
jgi:hypothetical protein